MKKAIFLLLCGVAVKSAAAAAPVIAVIGDSTAAQYSASSEVQGWGQVIPQFFSSDVLWHDQARCGWTLKGFCSDPNGGQSEWSKVLALRPDYVFIQFGTNDSYYWNQNPSWLNPAPPQSWGYWGEDAATFGTLLQQCISDCRALNIKPILISPASCRNFDASGKINNYLAPYAVAMQNVARNNDVGFIDVNNQTVQFHEYLGPAGVAPVGPASSPDDSTHYSREGAMAIDSLIVAGLSTAAPELRSYMNPVDYSGPLLLVPRGETLTLQSIAADTQVIGDGTLVIVPEPPALYSLAFCLTAIAAVIVRLRK